VTYDSTWTSPAPGATNAPPAVCWTAGRVDFVVRGTNNAIYHGYHDTSAHYWTSLGGSALSEPVIANSSGYLYMFVIGGGNSIWYRRMTYSSNTWDSWRQIPGKAQAIAAVGAFNFWSSRSYVEVVVRGMDNGVYFAYQDVTSYPTWGSGAGVWQNLGGATNDSPAITYNRQVPGQVLIVVRGIDNKLYAGRLDFGSTGWTLWSHLGGSTISSPALASFYYSVDDEWRTMLVVRGSTNSVYYMTYYPLNCFGSCANGWYLWWYPLSGSTDKAPAVAADMMNSVTVFVRGLNGHLYARTSHENGGTGSWYSWADLGGSTSDNPVAAMLSVSNGVAMYVRGADNKIYQKWSYHP